KVSWGLVAVVASCQTLPNRFDPVVNLSFLRALFLMVHLSLETAQCVFDIALVLHLVAQRVDQRIHLPLLNGISEPTFSRTPRHSTGSARVGCAGTRAVLRGESHRRNALPISIYKFERASERQAAW